MPRCPSCPAFTSDDRGHRFRRVLNRRRAPECDYRRIRSHATHLGQLKLLLSEIEFLTPYARERFTVIYAGAAPGLHIPYLARLFPRMRFVLIDPQPSAVRATDRIEIVQRFMSGRLAATLRESHGGPLLFISDVRVAAGSADESDRQQQRRIQRDMDAQMSWHRILDPEASMFKFRLPWDLCRHTPYLDGTIMLPAFGKQLTHETRLIVERGASVVQYDNRRYERQMAFFNQITRTAAYDGGRCYDCEAFRQIVARYFYPNSTPARVERMCDEIERELQDKAREWAVVTQ